MALFTDPDVVALDDLLAFESSLLQVSTTHGIDVETKIALATSGIGDKVMLWLLNSGASDPQYLYRRTFSLSTVVVTPTLYRWICFDSLSRVFAEAYNVQLNTRFQGKWTEYKQESQVAADMVFMSGIGIVYDPLPKPAMASLQTTPGNNMPESIFVQTTWVDCKGNESAASPITGELLIPFSGLLVGPVSQGAKVPSSAVAWNVYANVANGKLQLQNANPIPLGSAWQMPNEGLVNGRVAPSGQIPDLYVALTRRVQRG
jgi:hypothetical protein